MLLSGLRVSSLIFNNKILNWNEIEFIYGGSKMPNERSTTS